MPYDFDPSACIVNEQKVEIPAYLEKYYWWAYVRPWAVRVFERDWLINLILLGNYKRLRDAALRAMGKKLTGRTLQVSCCYGSLTPMLCERVTANGGTLDVFDVSPAQLDNLRKKLPKGAPAKLMLRDAANNGLKDNSYDRVLVFFLPHEQPRNIREKTLLDAYRVLKPNGQMVIVEFAKPKWWHPIKYVYLPFLKYLEPFAPDIWAHDFAFWMPKTMAENAHQTVSVFGGLFQSLVIEKLA